MTASLLGLLDMGIAGGPVGHKGILPLLDAGAALYLLAALVAFQVLAQRRGIPRADVKSR